MRTPTKHSTNVDTAQPVVPVPNVVNRPPITASGPDTILTTNIRNSSVRYYLNSSGALSDSLISVQPQFIFSSPSKLSTKEQFGDHSMNSHVPKKLIDFETKGLSGEAVPAQMNPIAIITPTKVSPQIIPLMQTSEFKTYARPNLQPASSLGTSIALPTNTLSQNNAKTTFPLSTGAISTLSAEMPPSVTSNLLATLKPLKHDPMTPQSFTAVTINTTGHASSSTTSTIVGPIFKASSLVSHSTLPTFTTDATPIPSPLISIVSVDALKCGTSIVTASAPTITAIRPTQRIALAPNRPVTSTVPLHRSPIGRQSLMSTLSPHNSSSVAGPLTPSRKRSRKQQLLAPLGSGPTASTTTTAAASASVPQNVCGLETTQHQHSSVSSPLPVATLAPCGASSSTTGGHVLNLRLFPRVCQTNTDKDALPAAYDEQHASLPHHASHMTPQQVPNLVATTSSCVTTAAPEPLQTHTISIAASLVTASSFQCGTGQTHQQQPLYMFPASTNTATLRTVTPQSSVVGATTTSVGNFWQVRFRTPTPNSNTTPKKPIVSSSVSTGSQQAIRTVLNQPLVNNLSSSTNVTQPRSTLRVAPPRCSSPAAVVVSPPQIERSTSKFATSPASPYLLIGAKTSPLEHSGQPTVPVLRVPDPNCRHFYDNAVQPTSPSPSKRPRKQPATNPHGTLNNTTAPTTTVTNSATNSGGIKKQCTWELRTDPMDSNRSVWRAPPTEHHANASLQDDDHSLSTQTSLLPTGDTLVVVARPHCRAQGVSPEQQSVRELADGVEDEDWAIHGCPPRMHLYKSSPVSRFSGIGKGSKTDHFLRSSEIRQRVDSFSSAPLGSDIFSPASVRQRRRMLRDHHGASSSSQQDPPAPDVPFPVSPNADLKTISEILELRNQHAETEFVNHPVHTTSTMDISGWRIVWCLRNFDEVIASEYTKLKMLSVLSNKLQSHLTARQKKTPLNADSTKPSSSDETADALESADEKARRQALITCLFLQAIPPANTRNSAEECATAKPEVDEAKITPTVLEDDLQSADELLKGLCLRVHNLAESLQRVSSLSRNLLLSHKDGVMAFIDDLQFRQREAEVASPDDHHSRQVSPPHPSSSNTSAPPTTAVMRQPPSSSQRHTPYDRAASRDSDSDGDVGAGRVSVAVRRSKPTRRGVAGRRSVLESPHPTNKRVVYPLGRRR